MVSRPGGNCRWASWLAFTSHVGQTLTTVTEALGAYRNNKAELDVANDGIVGTIQAVEQGKIVRKRADKDEMAVDTI